MAIQVAPPDTPWVQIDFDVRPAPLEFAFSNDRLTRAPEDGWVLCRRRVSEWAEFKDATVTPSRFTQEQLVALYKNDVLITLIGTYHSDSNEDAVRKDQSERPIQHGVVTE